MVIKTNCIDRGDLAETGGIHDRRDLFDSEDRLPDCRGRDVEFSNLLARKRLARPGVAAYLDTIDV